MQSRSALLHWLLYKNAHWKWTDDDEKLFKELKNICSTSDTLVNFDEDKPLVLATDASDKGVGAVLLHRFKDGTDHLIAYASQSLKDSEKRYAPIDNEGLAIVFGVAKFHQ